MGNKVSIITNSKGDDMVIHTDFQYRYGVLKKLKVSLKELKKSVASAVTHMESAPENLHGVGSSYLNLCACLKHGGASEGSTHCRGQAEGGERAPSNRSKVDLQLADKSFIGFQRFCDAMDDLKTGVCAKFRTEMHATLTRELEKLLADTDLVLALGKRTKISLTRFSTAARLVSRYESAAVGRGTDLSTGKGYAKACSDRNTKEEEFKAVLEIFDQRYKDVMVTAQEFCGLTTDIFLDNVVVCYREIIRLLDVVDSPQSSRFRSDVPEMVLHQLPGVELDEAAVGNRDDDKSSVTTEPKRLD